MYSNPTPASPQWPAVARAGVIYSVNAWLDVDAGFQARLNRASGAPWDSLLGATCAGSGPSGLRYSSGLCAENFA